MISGYSASHRPPLIDGLSVLNSILRNLSELGLKVQQFQSDQEEVVVQRGRAGYDDDDIAQFYQQDLY